MADVGGARWPRPFLDGVADAEGHHAIRRDSRGQLVALNLDEGRVLWRSGLALRPLIVTDALALGLALAPPRVVALPLVGAPDAPPPAWTSPRLPWPEWAATDPDGAGVDIALDAAQMGAVIALAWTLRPRYTGGAAPAAGSPRAAPVHGGCGVDLANGRILPPVPLPPRPADEGRTDAVDDPTVLAQQRFGKLTYRLTIVDAGTKVRTVLCALDARQGTLHWECVLDEAPRRRPMPPRPLA